MKEKTALEVAESLEEMGRIKDMGRPPTKDIERLAAKMLRHMQSRLEELNQKVEELEKENASLKQDAARWGAARNKVCVESNLGMPRFIFNILKTPPNVMRGSVAEHFTKAIDAAIQASKQ